jgi:nitrite reductase (NADH) small subunit
MTVVVTRTWSTVCRYDDLTPERAVAALVDDCQIAVVRTHDGKAYAVSNIDPFTGAAVISRGIVGTRDGSAAITSPLHKQTFDLSSGRCLDDPARALACYPVRLVAGQVEVQVG